MDEEKKQQEEAREEAKDETLTAEETPDLSDGTESENAAAGAVEPAAEKVRTKKHFSKKKAGKIIALVIVVIFVLQCIGAAVFYSMALAKGTSSGLQKLLGGKGAPKGQAGGSAWVTSLAKDRSLTDSEGLKLHAYYIKASGVSHSYVILCHPYSTDGTAMATFAKHYYSLGFNILLPDARGHGKSEGSVTMGWLDRLDLVEWVNQIVKADPNANIILHGVSMGGAEVAMASGENLPGNVRFIVDDSGYSSVWDEFSYQFGKMFSLPSFPTVNLASGITKMRGGWSFGEASTLKQVRKSKTPILFIHGSADEIVPISQSNVLYDACSAECKQLVISGAGHAQCESKDSEKYWAEVERFMLQYFSF